MMNDAAMMYQCYWTPTFWWGHGAHAQSQHSTVIHRQSLKRASCASQDVEARRLARRAWRHLAWLHGGPKWEIRHFDSSQWYCARGDMPSWLVQMNMTWDNYTDTIYIEYKTVYDMDKLNRSEWHPFTSRKFRQRMTQEFSVRHCQRSIPNIWSSKCITAPKTVM